jgi:hypothetical protein
VTHGPLTEPDRHARLRLEVGRLRQRESRRRYDVTVHVGTPGGARCSLVVPSRQLDDHDRQLRVEILVDMLERAVGADHAWLTRPGRPDVHDLDLEWLAAATTAFGVHGRPLHGFYAMTREGWLDVRTGERRVWRRLRL